MEAAISGINATIFVYGQTSSGKTFTMRGNESEVGLIQLSISTLFEKLESLGEEFKVNISYLEIYNESINDLLDPSKTKLEVRESISKGVYI